MGGTVRDASRAELREQAAVQEWLAAAEVCGLLSRCSWKLRKAFDCSREQKNHQKKKKCASGTPLTMRWIISGPIHSQAPR